MHRTMSSAVGNRKWVNVRSIGIYFDVSIPQRVILSIFGFLAIVNAFVMRHSIDVVLPKLAKSEIVMKSCVDNDNCLEDSLETAKAGTLRICNYLEKYCNKNIRELPFMKRCESKAETVVAVSETVRNKSLMKNLEDMPGSVRTAVMVTFYLGYVLTHVPGGLLAERYGGKWVLATALAVTAFFTIITPLVVRTYDIRGLIVLRFLMGLSEGPLFPALNTLMAHWIPAQERGTLGSLVLSAGHIGILVANLLSGILMPYYEWPVIFYFFGACALLWFICFITLCYDDPESSPYITESERNYLNESRPYSLVSPGLSKASNSSNFSNTSNSLSASITSNISIMSKDSCTSNKSTASNTSRTSNTSDTASVSSASCASCASYNSNTLNSSNTSNLTNISIETNSWNASRTSPPWGEIFTNVPMWALITATLQHDWTQALFINEIRQLMNDLENLNFWRNSITCVKLVTPFLLNWVVSVATGIISDVLINRNILNTTETRRIMTLIAAFGPTVSSNFTSCLLCNESNDISSIFSCAVGVAGAYYAGAKLTTLDLSPNYAGTIMGIANGLGSITSIIAPFFEDVALESSTVRYMQSLVWLICTMFTSGEVQPFDGPILQEIK